jgi:hypothetical protein
MENTKSTAERSVASTVTKCMVVQLTYIKLRVQESENCQIYHGARSFWLGPLEEDLGPYYGNLSKASMCDRSTQGIRAKGRCPALCVGPGLLRLEPLDHSAVSQYAISPNLEQTVTC